MKQNNATRRLGEQLREKLGYILLFEVSDPRLDLVTLTGVEVSIEGSVEEMVERAVAAVNEYAAKVAAQSQQAE